MVKTTIAKIKATPDFSRASLSCTLLNSNPLCYTKGKLSSNESQGDVVALYGILTGVGGGGLRLKVSAKAEEWSWWLKR